jgi:hypothetical protein
MPVSSCHQTTDTRPPRAFDRILNHYEHNLTTPIQAPLQTAIVHLLRQASASATLRHLFDQHSADQLLPGLRLRSQPNANDDFQPATV